MTLPYEKWNSAIARYFTANVTRGSSVFLTLNDDALGEIAANFLDASESPLNPVASFVESVCKTVVNGSLLSLERIRRLDTGSYPKGTAFLGIMVLAAHRMAGDAEMSSSNYFLRLTQLLKVSTGHQGNRPMGLAVGDEEAFWHEWNRWLQEQGLQQTAKPGPEGSAHRYLNYVFSQALLRDDDKVYLSNKFRDSHGPTRIGRSMDEMQLAGWLQRAGTITRRYLREGFRNSEPQRAAAFYEAAYRVYQSFLRGESSTSFLARSRSINAGLARIVSLSGQLLYRIFVPQPANWISKSLCICSPNTNKFEPLTVGRNGHFEALWPQAPFGSDAVSYALNGDPMLDSVVFPQRDFWILTQDPEDATGSYATWEKFPNLLGQKFILICSTDGDQHVQDEMEKFRDAKLIEWDKIVSQTSAQLHEYQGCMVLSSGWEGVVPSENCVGLLEALKPKQYASIGLSGGIRAPGQNAWLVGHPPDVTVFGFEENFELKLFSDEKELFCISHQRQMPLALDREHPAGIYMLQVNWNKQNLYSRSFRLIEWEDLETGGPGTSLEAISVFISKRVKISGPCITDIPANAENV